MPFVGRQSLSTGTPVLAKSSAAPSVANKTSAPTRAPTISPTTSPTIAPTSSPTQSTKFQIDTIYTVASSAGLIVFGILLWVCVKCIRRKHMRSDYQDLKEPAQISSKLWVGSNPTEVTPKTPDPPTMYVTDSMQKFSRKYCISVSNYCRSSKTQKSVAEVLEFIGSHPLKFHCLVDDCVINASLGQQVYFCCDLLLVDYPEYSCNRSILSRQAVTALIYTACSSQIQVLMTMTNPTDSQVRLGKKKNFEKFRDLLLSLRVHDVVICIVPLLLLLMSCGCVSAQLQNHMYLFFIFFRHVYVFLSIHAYPCLCLS